MDRHGRATVTTRRGRARPSGATLLIGVAAAVAVIVGSLVGGTPATVAADTPAVPALDGSSAGNAAASCWEAKQLHPASVDGVYWLRTEAMQRPEQFYCDMTTDGGGWVLIGRGREGWTFRDYGQLTPQAVRDDVESPAAFSPGALSTDLINGLLDNRNVSELVDGVRLRRATEVSPGPADWQELRWRFADLTTWSWAFGGGHRLADFSIDGAGNTGSNTKDSKISMPGEAGAGNRGADDRDAWFTFPWSGHGGQAGFSFGGDVDGADNATSYLWEYAGERHAMPFTQVYLRPRITTPTLPAIADAGTVEQVQSPLLEDRPYELAGGVVGVRKVGDSEPHLDTPVLAITTAGDRVYVGGKFDDVRDTATGTLVDQNYLAAFDRDTGAWISSFTPQLDGTVFDLAVADGKLIVAGQFTNVDGAPRTAALVALDPITGDVVSDWTASLQVTGTTARPLARAIDIETVDGVPWVYVGGNFTRIEHERADGSTLERNAARLARVRLSDGFPDGSFLPDIEGVPYDLDAIEGRVHVVGDFDGVNGNDDKGVSTVDATNGVVVAGLAQAEYTTSKFSRQYQQAVLAVGPNVFQGGSEHNTHVYTRSGYELIRSHVTSGRGGDTQALAVIDGTVYQASHGNSWHYSDAVTWPGLTGYTRADDYKWVGAFDATDYSYEPTWVPSMRSAFTEGVWELHADVDGCLWFGGDILGGPYVNGQRQYLESFSKFCQRDVQAPTVPANPAASPVPSGGMRVDWTDSTDDRPGFIGYEVLRNDRVISDLVYGRTFVDPDGGMADRYFVRAVDPAGNRSASSGVLVPGDNVSPTTPTDLAATILVDGAVELSWTSSTDDVGVEAYRIYRNGVELELLPVDDSPPTVTTTIEGLAAGPHWLQVRAIDGAGNESFKTPPVRVDIDGPDTQRPTQPGSPAAAVDPESGIITFTWTESSDDTAVVGYTVRRNLVEVAVVDATTLAVDLDLGSGGHYLQVEASDAAGNTSYRTAPVFVDVSGGDVQPPTTPRDLAGTVLADGTIEIDWTASTDDVGVAEYLVLRNGVEIQVVDGQTTSATLVGLGTGSHFIQVRAVDAAGNESFKTPPIELVVAAADTQPPSTPGSPAAVVEADGTITFTWLASSDNVGVDRYRVLRNLAEVDVTAGDVLSSTLDLGVGNHWLQVQAIDAAGNESFRTSPVLVTR